MDSMKEDLREKGLVGDEFEDREEWRCWSETRIPHEKQANNAFKYKKITVNFATRTMDVISRVLAPRISGYNRNMH